jgi:hypothetical protein
VANAARRRIDLPLATWLAPLATAAAAIVVWTAWCDSPAAAWIGGVCIVGTGLLVLSFVFEGLPHGGGITRHAGRLLLAVAAGIAAAAVTFVAAAVGLHLRCPIF